MKLTKDQIEEWCDENGFALIKTTAGIIPLSNREILNGGIAGIFFNVCKHTGFTKKEICQRTRKREIVEVRQICHSIAKRYLNISLANVGFEIGRKDPPTVINSAKKVSNLIETDKQYFKKYEKLIQIYRLNE